MAIHNCPDCGLVHEVTEQRESAEVAIARIQAESALEIARLQTRAEKHAVETLAEADMAVAEVQAAADVAEAEEVGDAVEAGLEPADIPVLEIPEPEMAVEQPVDETVPPDVEEMPSAHEPRRRGMGVWG